MRNESFLNKPKKQLIATSCAVLMLSAFLPTLSTAKASELTEENINTYVQTNVNNIPLKTAQPSLIGIGPGQIQIGNSNMDQLTLRISQTFTQNERGNYVFDETKARALGFSEDDISKAQHYFTNVLTQNEIRTLVGDNSPIVSPYSKASVTAKAVAAALSKYAKKIDSAIDTAIDALPFVSDQNKTTWKKTLTTVALVKVLNNFIGVTDTVEGFLIKGILTLIPGMPEWIASGIAKTLMMILPI